MEYLIIIFLVFLISLALSSLAREKATKKIISIVFLCLFFFVISFVQFFDGISYTTERIGTAGTVGYTAVIAEVHVLYDEKSRSFKIKRVISTETGRANESYVNAELTYDRLPEHPEIQELSDPLFSTNKSMLTYLDESITGLETEYRRPVDPLKKIFRENSIQLSDNSIVILYGEPFPVYRVVDFKNKHDLMIYGWWDKEPAHISTPVGKLNIYSVKNSRLIEDEWRVEGYESSKKSFGREVFYYPEISIALNQGIFSPLKLICISALPEKANKDCSYNELQREVYFHIEEGAHFEKGSKLVIDTPKGMIKTTYPPSIPVDLVIGNLERREITYDTEKREARIEVVNGYYQNWLGALFIGASFSSIIHWIFIAFAMIFADEIKGRFIAPLVKAIFNFKRQKS